MRAVAHYFLIQRQRSPAAHLVLGTVPRLDGAYFSQGALLQITRLNIPNPSNINPLMMSLWSFANSTRALWSSARLKIPRTVQSNPATKLCDLL